MVKKLMRRGHSTSGASEPVATLNGAATLFGFIARLWEGHVARRLRFLGLVPRSLT